MRKLLLALAVCALAGFAAPVARAADEDAAGTARWQALQHAIFGEHAVMQDGSGVIRLDAPMRALDAALVPISIAVTTDAPVKSVYLVIDANPAPVAAHITFGPNADDRSLTMRVRVNDYTLVHAVAETADGKLYETAKFVKATGGCSAPAGSDDAAALKDIGHMKLRLLDGFVPGKAARAQLLIRHPNFNGMQMNQVTRLFTPARFIQSTEVTYNGAEVFHMQSDISLATDPAITFGFVPKQPGQMKVVVRDSKNTVFEHSFDLPASGA